MLWFYFMFTEKLKVSMYYLVFCSEEVCAICKAGNVWRKGDSAVSWGLRLKLICLHSDNLTQPSNWLFQSGLLMQSSGRERESFRTCIFMCEGVISRPEPAIRLLILDFFLFLVILGIFSLCRVLGSKKEILEVFTPFLVFFFFPFLPIP